MIHAYARSPLQFPILLHVVFRIHRGRPVQNNVRKRHLPVGPQITSSGLGDRGKALARAPFCLDPFLSRSPHKSELKININVVRDLSPKTVDGLKKFAAEREFLPLESRYFLCDSSIATRQYHHGVLWISKCAEIVNLSILGDMEL